MEALANDFRIEVQSWLESSAITPIEKHALASLSIIADGTPVCELDDLIAKTVRPDIRASAYHLALWLTANWWRLRWEPERSTTDWRLSHQISAAGAGFAWPSLTFASDGDFILVRNVPTEVTAISPVRYIRNVCLNVRVTSFEAAVEGFVEAVLSRLSGLGCGGSNLSLLAEELRDERSDPELSSWRKLEALLGFDPDAAPEELASKLAEEKARIGEGAIDELAFRSEVVDEIAWDLDGLACELPWKMAERAAKAARSAWGLARGPIDNARLAELLGVPQTAITEDYSKKSQLAAGYRNGKANGRIGIVLKSPYPENRRFELMRIIGDCLIAESGDHLLPVTRAKTFRQKFQRAFAQEVLCPWADLDGLVGTEEPDDDTISNAARHFDVSQRLIETTLVNKGRLLRDTLPA
jgi:hypothetical protein